MSYRILIVENDPVLRRLLSEMLTEERAGDQIVAVGSAAEALREMSRQPANLLITDWRMPNMDGVALIEKVKRIYPDTQAILLTTTELEEIQERSRHSTASFVLFPKPFPIDRFLNHIEQSLKAPAPATTKQRTPLLSDSVRGEYIRPFGKIVPSWS
jgi:DNA-binding NtrC family response regulator